MIDLDDTKPIYLQIAEWLENEIIAGRFKENDKVYSQYQLAELFNINPATAAKGLNVLADEQVVYKKRGLGMFVQEGAREAIMNKRKNETLSGLIQELVLEAKRLNVKNPELFDMIKKARGEKE